MKKTFATIAISVCATLAVSPATQSQALTANHPVPAWMKKTCQVEDDSNCYWDATTEGNEVGYSFYARKMANGNVCLFYISAKAAKKYDKCYKN